MTSIDPRLVLVARSETAESLVVDCVEGRLPFSGPNSLYSKFSAMGWSTKSLYETVRAYEARALDND